MIERSNHSNYHDKSKSSNVPLQCMTDLNFSISLSKLRDENLRDWFRFKLSNHQAQSSIYQTHIYQDICNIQNCYICCKHWYLLTFPPNLVNNLRKYTEVLLSSAAYNKFYHTELIWLSLIGEGEGAPTNSITLN